MNVDTLRRLPKAALLLCGLLAPLSAGCQANIAGQTLPSAYFLQDDVQFFPAGEETPLPNLRRALEEYRIERQLAIEGSVQQVP